MRLRPVLFVLCAFLLSCEKDGPIGDVIETSKRTIKAAQDTHQEFKSRIESIKKEKAKIDQEVREENAQYGRNVDSDVANAEAFITQEKGHLRCRLRPLEGAFKVIKQTEHTSIIWFVDGVKVTRRHMECGSGGASLGVGLGAGGRSCASIGGPHDRQGLYPYQVPKDSLDDAEFVCRLHFPKTLNHVWKDLLSADLDVLVKVSSKPVRWPMLRSLRAQGLGR